MNILVSFKARYGKNLFYPKNKDAQFLAEFTGRPTLLKRQLKMALERGWSVEIQQEKLDISDFLNENNSQTSA